MQQITKQQFDQLPPDKKIEFVNKQFKGEAKIINQQEEMNELFGTLFRK